MTEQLTDEQDKNRGIYKKELDLIDRIKKSPLPAYDTLAYIEADLRADQKRRDDWMEQARENKTCSALGCTGAGFPYCEGHDAP